MNKDELKNIPSVTEVLETTEIAGLVGQYPRSFVVDAIRRSLDHSRNQIMAGNRAPSPGDLVETVKSHLQSRGSMSLRQVVNATGVVLHTNLGRAVLSAEAVRAVMDAATGFVNLEYDLEKGQRSSRQDHITGLLRDITGAESALVVNNNAGAILLCLDTLARSREVIVSRGQLVEIGGSFRLPDIMEKSGARLVEVGTTNRTYPSDYSARVNESTVCLLRVHPSNFRQSGYTAEVDTKDLVALGKEHGLLVLEDQGSGTLVDLERYGVTEKTVRRSILTGVDLVTFSGDKLLGGPQAGIIVGKSHLIQRLRLNPLARALRIDKLSLAALEATLRLYLDEEGALTSIPTLVALTEPLEILRLRAVRLAEAIKGTRLMEIGIEQGTSQAGGGANPGEDLPSWVVTVKPLEESASSLEENLRKSNPPVICRIQRDRVILDLRTIRDTDIALISRAFSG